MRKVVVNYTFAIKYFFVKAFETEGYLHADCGAHKLNLVVNKAIFQEKDIKKVLVRCRALVGHFKHSGLAQGRLKDEQQRLGLLIHTIKQVQILLFYYGIYYVVSRRSILVGILPTTCARPSWSNKKPWKCI
jgi:hypothetical protein